MSDDQPGRHRAQALAEKVRAIADDMATEAGSYYEVVIHDQHLVLREAAAALAAAGARLADELTEKDYREQNEYAARLRAERDAIRHTADELSAAVDRLSAERDTAERQCAEAERFASDQEQRAIKAEASLAAQQATIRELAEVLRQTLGDLYCDCGEAYPHDGETCGQCEDTEDCFRERAEPGVTCYRTISRLREGLARAEAVLTETGQ